MKTLSALALIGSTLISGYAIADNHCDVNLDANFSLKQNHMTFSKGSQELYKITADNQVIINGSSLSLDNAQQMAVDNYANSIRETVPQVRTLAVEGVDIAIEGVNLAFNGLLGEGNNVSEELTYELSSIRDQLEQKFDQDAGIYIGNDGEMTEDLLGEDFEQRFEDTLESVIENSMGTLLMAVGREMIFSGGDMEAFETRMEAFGQDIETQVEARAESLEVAAHKLCESIVEIDNLEKIMQSSIEELSTFDVINVQNQSYTEI